MNIHIKLSFLLFIIASPINASAPANSNKNTILMPEDLKKAIQNGDEEGVKLRLNTHPNNIVSVDQHGNSTFMIAVIHDQFSLITTLSRKAIQQKKFIDLYNHTNNSGQTISALLEQLSKNANFDINKKESYGITARHLSKQYEIYTRHLSNPLK